LRVLRLNFSSYEPLPVYSKACWLQMAANSSSVSYRGTLTKDALLTTLATGTVPAGFAAHIGHLLDEVSISVIVMSVVEVAQETQTPIRVIWNNVAHLASRHSDHRRSLWAMFAGAD
jgi:hypothetical protein